jgi:hypothetical protein
MPSPLTLLRARLSSGGPAVLKVWREVDGLLSVDECRLLFRLARGRRTIVEIGSFRGKSAVLLGLGSADVGGRIAAIDPHFPSDDAPDMPFGKADVDAFWANIDRFGLRPRVDHVVATSRDALEPWGGRPIDLLWVDGDHTEAGARFDLEAWGALVRPGGVIAAHDYRERFPGVRKAWDETITPARGWTGAERVRSIAWAVRTG